MGVWNQTNYSIFVVIQKRPSQLEDIMTKPINQPLCERQEPNNGIREEA